MQKFLKEFHTLNYAIKESQNILLFAHSRPDGDTTGSCFALKEYIKSLGKNVDVGCFDPMPDSIASIVEDNFSFPARLDLSRYKLIIACDSVERGFEKIKNKLGESQVIALIDHHPDITMSGDINMIDPTASSVCEIVYGFFKSSRVPLTKEIADCLMLGLLGDTGMFQHSNTTPYAMEIASELMRKGASLTKIVHGIFTNKKISTLKLWGKAFEKARIISSSGMIVTALTLADLEQCRASTEDIAQVASILNTVPGTKFSLILSEREDGIVKGSLRSEEYKNVDVSKIAATFGGGGHKLASGFELKGKIVETQKGWEIV
jgi:bifunctional oligoribonuclease and PAP phosphatase NrnA